MDIILPKIGIGCWSFGGGDYWGDQSQNEVNSIVAAAQDQGLNYFDTAEAYNAGGSEESLGKALKGRRNRVILGSKASPSNCGRSSLIAHCEESLRRLGTDYLDIYMLHWPLDTRESSATTGFGGAGGSPGVEYPGWDDAAFAMNRLISDGKVRYAGVSNHGVQQMALARKAGLDIKVNQVMYNLLSRAVEFETVPDCLMHDVTVMGYMPLLQGLLAGKFQTLADVPEKRMRTRHFSGERPGARHGGKGYEELVTTAIARIEKLAAAHGVSAASAAIAWCVSRDFPVCEIQGIRSLSQLESAVSALETAKNTSLMNDLDVATRDLKDAMGPSIDYWESDSNSRSR
jgi:aryl-alcohol dehydrogenase-like predicted oxidoreductase